jgi:ribosomal protein L29
VPQTIEYLYSLIEGVEDLEVDVVPDIEVVALGTQLLALEREEARVSAARRQLHERLASFPNVATEERERQLSKRRRELHAEIDRLRVELALLGSALTAEIDSVRKALAGRGWGDSADIRVNAARLPAGTAFSDQPSPGPAPAAVKAARPEHERAARALDR